MFIRLVNIPVGAEARVIKLMATGAIRRRLQDIGLTEGSTVKCLHKSPPGDPAAYLVRGAVIALRSEESAQIIMERCEARE